jgi:signal transduction histidine kinase
MKRTSKIAALVVLVALAGTANAWSGSWSTAFKEIYPGGVQREAVREKHKVLQILVNLVQNPKQACYESGQPEKHLILRVTNGEDRVRIAVIDNGVGIPAENLTRIFNHGFTPRKGGHGFGLHSGALAAKEMGGSLRVAGEGRGKGATFTLELPAGREGRSTIQFST